MRLPFLPGRRLTRTRIEAALAELLAEHPDYDVRPHWDESGDGALAIVLDRRGRATVGTTERGITRDPHVVTDMDHVLYHAMNHATFIAAMKEEMRTRTAHPGPDPFQRLLAIHRERLARIRPHWGERRRREQERLGLLARPGPDPTA